MKLERMLDIEIGGKEYSVQEAKTKEELLKGLSGVTSLPKDQGMLFYFGEPQEVSMWMKDTEIPLDIVFINEDLQVTKVHTGQPEDETLISQSDTMYVLEVNANSGIKEGDILEFDEDDEDAPVMWVLAQDQSKQMPLWGGERIISRRETKVIVSKAKKIEEVKKDQKAYESKCKNLGKYVFKVFRGQDNRPAEYVKSPK